MDRGAARSKKRLQQLEKAAQARPAPGPRAKAVSSSAEAGPSSRPPRPAKPLPQKKQRPVPEAQSRDPELYKAKAVRSNAALDWNTAPFEIPPASLEGITRVDLTGSGVTDVSWLRGSSVRWLGVSGCKIEDWSAIGSLSELTVLNINECGLTELPDDLKTLRKLKALVAMNNPWTTISSEVLASWPELNSLSKLQESLNLLCLIVVISHSPNLTAIPRLKTLIHLSKITFSHCPRITPASIPSMSDLPLLRDVKMNNLPLLTTLPRSLQYWGTGPMSSLNPTDERKGQGLEVLDVGSCSLGEGTLDMLKKADFPILRSLTLHHNPLDVARPKYAEELQGLRNVPKLAIIDNKRVVERVKKEGGEKAKKGKNKQSKGKPSGANSGGKGKMREWGSKQAEGEASTETMKRGEEQAKPTTEGEKRDGGKKEKKRKRFDEASEAVPGAEKKRSRTEGAESSKSKTSSEDANKRTKTKAESVLAPAVKASNIAHGKTADATPAAVIARVADPSALTTAPTKKHSKNETGVYGVVEVGDVGAERANAKQKKRKGEAGRQQGSAVAMVSKPHAGIDLKSLVSGKGDNGLGVDTW